MSCQHEIKLTNFQTGETVSYPLLILKGLIKNNCKLCETDNIYASSIDEKTVSFRVVNDKFKALVELNLGHNVILLKYCSAVLRITLNYEPKNTKFTVLPLYIIFEGHEGAFQAPSSEDNSVTSACMRITLASKLLQSVISEKLYENNQGRKTFQLEGACRVFRSSLNVKDARKMNQYDLWQTLGREVVASNLEANRIKFLGFISCTKYYGETYKENFSFQDILNMTQGHVALGGGGFALFGTACLYTWPEKLAEVIERFENSSFVDRYNFMDDSNNRGTLGACYSTTFGAVLHELCHTFDLGHTEEGIMARGFDDIDKIFIININKENENRCDQSKRLRLKSLVERRKEFNVNIRDDEEGGAFWTRSCIIILAYHRWLNNFQPSKKTIQYNTTSNVITSTAGLRVIEIRREEDAMVLSNWTFESRILKYSFQLPVTQERKSLLFVEDNVGNIFMHVATI